MTRRERIREFVEKHYKDAVASGEQPGVDAQTVVAALSINRSDASADLNKLWREGILAKIGKKPVKFFPAEKKLDIAAEPVISSQTASTLNKACQLDHEEKLKNPGRQGSDKDDSSFSSIIGANGSIKAQIQLSKAAVAYPPCGLHTLITGESGVGKSLLAEEMWRYGLEIGAFSPSRQNTHPFVLFSCADYAENPQLLLSQLFGHAKGAFSGATEDKAGLVESAEGGVLFLDEIHRLPPTGQELFFTLFDKGIYRRLGETKERKSNIMIIGATTEDPNGVLLATFIRRIPVIIQLPKLSERPPCERLSLIMHFMSQEANRLELPIWVSGRALKILVSYDCRANIGDLKNDIKLSCAKSYLSYLTGQDSKMEDQGLYQDLSFKRRAMLSIDINDLPQKVYSAVQRTDALYEGILPEIFESGFTARPSEGSSVETAVNDYEVFIDLYSFVQRRLDSYKYLAMRHEELESTIGRELEQYYYAAIQALRSRDDCESIPPGILTLSVWNMSNDILKVASKRLERRYSRSISVALAMHLQQFIGRIKTGQIIYNPHLHYIKTQYPDEMEAATAAIPVISQHLGVVVPEDEVGFLAMFLTQPIEVQQRPRIGLVVAAHGRATASSMAEVANHLLSTNHVRSVDAPLNWSLAEIFEDLCRVVRQCDQGKGVLIVGDMGSFLDMEDDLFRKTGVLCRVILNASTTLVLEAGKVVLTSDADLDEVVQIVASASQTYISSLWNTMMQKEGSNERFNGEIRQNEYRNAGTRGAVITICPSGAGTASKIKEILLENLPIARVMDIIPVSALDDVSAIADKLRKRLRLVIGSIDPGLSGVPYVGIDKVLSSHGLKEIDVLLKGWDMNQSSPKLPDKDYSREEALVLINDQMHQFAPSLEAEAVMKQCMFILREIEEKIYHKQMPIDVMTRIYLHAACMFERLATGQSLPTPSWAENIKQQRKIVFNLLCLIAAEAASSLRLNMLESEVCYFLVTLPELDE